MDYNQLVSEIDKLTARRNRLKKEAELIPDWDRYVKTNEAIDLEYGKEIESLVRRLWKD